jgi:hypothetical protein
VAPFKAQNMSTNAAVTPDGLEIGRAQYVQALAARARPEVRMNPVLLKPSAETHSQVIVMGRYDAATTALPWLERRARLWPVVQSSLDGLLAEFDQVVIEVAGSPAEINLTAAKLVAETAGVGRFRSRAAFAAHTGTAPIPVWSGNLVRHRLSRGGDRQLNSALHRIAITQLRCPSLGQAYVTKRLAAGDTKTEAIRALRRRLSDEVFRRLQADEAARASSSRVERAAA